MKTDRLKIDWLLDAALFGGFLLAMWLDFTGLALHQWWGLAVGALAVYHLLRHQTWVAAVTKRLQRGAGGRTLRLYAVDAGLLAGIAGMTVTGVVISTWLDLPLAGYAAWRAVHVATAVVTAALIVLKIGLHWHWIVTVARRKLVPTPRRVASQPELAPIPVHVGRRDFVRLMGLVGASTLLLGVNALREDGAAGDAVAMAASSTNTDTGTVTESGSAATCTVRCGRGCSYPGHCRRYTDSHGNGKCDLGECGA